MIKIIRNRFGLSTRIKKFWYRAFPKEVDYK